MQNLKKPSLAPLTIYCPKRIVSLFIIAISLASLAPSTCLYGSGNERLIWANAPVLYPQHAAQRERYQIWDTQVYPIGNGRIGATLHGAPMQEHIQFNEDSLWVGNEDNTGGYQPFGDVYVRLDHEDYSDYRRELDIERAVHTVTYTAGGVRYKRESFASNPAQVMVFRFTADRAGQLTGTVSMGNDHEISITAEGDTLVMQGDTSKFWWWQLILQQAEKRLLADREYASPDLIVLDFEARTKVLHEGGKVWLEGNELKFENCDSLTLLLAADTNYVNQREQGWRGEHPHQRVLSQVEAAAKRSYGELLQEHIQDYQSLYQRFTIDLGETPDALRALPTADRVKAYTDAFASEAGPVDRGLEELLYQYGRYLMISCSRPGDGAMAANLQGLWLTRKRPPWRCDYHTDINLQMNYWLTGPSNLNECFIPLAEWIDSIREVRKEETRKVLGVDKGWLMRSENGIFGGSTWHFQKGDSAWLCQNLWDHYRFTMDEDYLRNVAYPIMKEISEFWVQHLKELPDGTLVAPEGRSPEHGPVGVDGVSYDQQLCWDLFTNMIEAASILEVDDDYAALLAEKRSRLLGPQVGRWGQLQEWMEDIDDPNETHRHNNHLVGVYPGRQIHPTINKKYADAAHVSVVARGNGPTGWSKAWKVAIFARLLDGEGAYRMLSDLLATKTYGNLWTTHPPFQIDCNFGYAAGINEMLLQSHLDVIELLPALPKAWSHGSIKGMRARGGFDLDFEWSNGRLTSVTVRNHLDQPREAQLRYGNNRWTVKLDGGSKQVITL